MGSSIGRFIDVYGITYFTAKDSFGQEVWQTDGTTAGTNMVYDINPYGNANTNFTDDFHFTRMNCDLYFYATDGTH